MAMGSSAWTLAVASSVVSLAQPLGQVGNGRWQVTDATAGYVLFVGMVFLE